MPTNKMTVDAGTLAKIFDVSVSTVRDLGTKKIIVSSTTPGRYKLLESVSAYIQELRRKQDKPKKGSASKQLQVEQVLSLRVKREQAEIDLEILKGNLHKSDQVAKLVAGMIVTARQQLLSLPSRIAVQLVGQPKTRIQRKLEDAVGEILTEMAGRDIEEDLKALSKFGESEIDYEEAEAGGDDDTS